MIDVVHVITGLGVGGAETMLVQLSVALQARGISQHVVSLTGHDALAADLRAVDVDVTVLRAGSSTSLPSTMLALVRVINRLQPRIVQGWMYHGNLAATLCHYICRGRRGRALFWNLRASNMDDERYGWLIRLSGLLSRSTDLVIANSEVGAAFHRQSGFRPKRMMTIPNGVNTEKFRPNIEARRRIRAELDIPENALVVAHLARVDPMKDHANFIAAIGRLPSVIGIMAGKDTQQLQVPPNLRALGPRRDSESLLAAADIVASTSAFGEGFSNVIAEGMSVGLVPVATDVGDARRIVGDTGIIVPPRDCEAFAAALRSLEASPVDERVQRGLKARDRILQNFTLESSIEQFAALYLATGKSGWKSDRT